MRVEPLLSRGNRIAEGRRSRRPETDEGRRLTRRPAPQQRNARSGGIQAMSRLLLELFAKDPPPPGVIVRGWMGRVSVHEIRRVGSRGPGGSVSPMTRSVLIIEDEAEFAEFVIAGLAEEGFFVCARRRREAGGRDAAQPPLGPRPARLAPPPPGRAFPAPRVPPVRVQAPVIFLTARDEVDDRVRGLDSGADDYLCKPFAFAELLARVLRPDPPPRAAVGPAPGPRRCRHRPGCPARPGGAGRPLDLTAKELALLSFFLRHPGRILTRDQIYEYVWDEAIEATSNTFEVHLKELRRKLEALGPRLIHNRRGQGYFLGDTPLREGP